MAGDAPRPKPKAKLPVAGGLVIFDAGLPARVVAQSTWKKDSLLDTGRAAMEGAASGPLRHEDQKAPVGAFIRVANGEYGFSSSDDVDFAGAGASLLWIRRLG